MHRCARIAAALFLLATATAGSGQEARPATPAGFLPPSRAAELEAESRAVAVPTPESARSWLRTLTEEPHVAGTPADYKTAVFVRDKLREWGWQADFAEYEVLLNYPVAGNVKLELVRPSPRKLKVDEDAYRGDKDSASPDAFPAFHGYGVSGDVTGQVVYANYGTPEDFAALEKMGVDVRGKIVLVRYYGNLFRGLKVLNAQKRGAAGVLIYSDPAEDGYARGDIYPRGPYRPPSGIQRGSVQFLSKGPGDPTTPGTPSIKGAKRLPHDPRDGFPAKVPPRVEGPRVTGTVFNDPVQFQARAVADWEKATGLSREDYFATIPSLPISYEAARPILEALGGPNVPAGWQGALPFAYHVGPGPAEVHFAIDMDYRLRTIWNVIATLRGAAEPDRWVMVGNHRDAWVYGAVDPGSGTATTMEMCRALGAAVKSGWKPRRTLLYASWDAEEYGLVGSTEWAEDHAEEIDAKAVMMLNVDSAVSGHELDLAGVPSLRDLALDAAGAITDPRTGKSLRSQWIDRERAAWSRDEPVIQTPTLRADSSSANHGDGRRFVPRLDALGSGSDYTAFLDHLGVPAVDVGFRGRYGVYHSIYDNFYWMETFCDPEFLTHATAARLYTLIAMRAAGAEVVPLRFTPYAQAIGAYLDDLRRIVERKARNESKDSFAFEGLPEITRAVLAFRDRAAALDQALDSLADSPSADAARLARANDAAMRVERAFLLKSGLPGRPWFRHTIYAPGLTTGYASWPLPGVRQAILEGNKSMLQSQGKALVERIDAASEALKAATEAASR